MKILLLTEFFPKNDWGEISGGVEARVYYLAKELEKSGHEVSILTSYLENTKRVEMWGRISIFRVGPKRTYTRSGVLFERALFALGALQKSFQLDFEILDASMGVVYGVGFVIARLLRKKLVFWVPDVVGTSEWIREQGLLSGIIAGFMEGLIVVLQPDIFIALSEATNSKLLRLGAKPRKIKIVYPGVITVSSRQKKSPDRKKLITLVCINRLAFYKRTDLVITAVSILKKRGWKIELRIIGKGEELEKLTKLARELKISRNILLLGNMSIKKVMQELSKAAIFCLASEVEGFGIVTLEAMSFGVPFVNSDIPAHKEILDHSQAGLLFESGNPQDLSTKIETILLDSKLWAQLSRRALEFAGEHTWQKVAKETLEVYKNI